MNDDLFNTPSPDQVEARVIAAALGLLSAFSDPKATKDRLQKLADASAEHAALREAAERASADAKAKLTAVEREGADLAKRIETFQLWVDSTEKSYRAREAKILENESRHATLDRELIAREADLNRRAATHEALVQRLREAV
jgi:hypothetical protein